MYLYEINKNIEALFDENGEIADVGKLNELEMAKSEKVENIGYVILNNESTLVALESEIKRLQERKARLEKQDQSLKNYLASQLNGEKFKTTNFSISFRKSTSVVIDDEALISDIFKTPKIVTTPDKKAIKEAIQKGEKVDGCHLQENTSVLLK